MTLATSQGDGVANDGFLIHAAGRRPNTVAIEGRSDGTVRARWWNDGQKQREPIPGIRVPLETRKLTREDQQLVESLGLRMSHALANGLDPRSVIGVEAPLPEQSSSSLGNAKLAYFSPESGVAVTQGSRVNYQGYANTLERVLKPAFDLDELAVDALEKVARQLAQEAFQKHEREVAIAKTSAAVIARLEKLIKRGVLAGDSVLPERIPYPRDAIRGLEATTKTIGWLFTLARWAFDRRLSQRRAELPQNWKELIRQIWRMETSQTPRPVRLWYSSDEMCQLFDPDVEMDPRMRQLLRTAIGSRLGQTRRCQRSDLIFLEDEVAMGVLTVPDGGPKKRGGPIDQSARALEAWYEAMQTYLAPWEKEYQAGTISNYYLFPGGALEDLETVDVFALTPCLTEDYLGKLFDDAERSAGITKMEGRRFHAVRRFFRSRAADLTTDRRVLDYLVSHNTGGVGAIYEDPKNVLVRKAALKVRETIISEITPSQERQ